MQTEEERVKEVRQGVTRRIKALGAEGKVREAIKELAGLAQVGVQPDTQAATALVAACVKNGNMDMAQGVFDELFGACWGCGGAGQALEAVTSTAARLIMGALEAHLELQVAALSQAVTPTCSARPF